MSCCLIHGRVSCTSYAVFSAPIKVPKMFDPDHAASTRPTDINPGAPDENTTFSSTGRIAATCVGGSAVVSSDMSQPMIFRSSAMSPTSGARNSSSGKSEKKKLYAAEAASVVTLSAPISRNVFLSSGPTR